MWNFINNLTIKTKILISVGILVVLSLTYNWYRVAPKVSTKVYTQAQPPNQVKDVPKKVIETKIKVYDKAKLKKKIELPPEVDLEETEVITVTDTPKTRSGMTVVTTVDKTTGETKSHIKEKELSLFGFENEKRLGVGYSINSKGETIVDTHAEYSFIRVGNIYGSVRGEVNTKAELKGTLNLDYRW